jgi:Domain of unknown function (DUF4918)
MISNFTQAEAILRFLRGLKPDFSLPKGVAVLNPFDNKEAFALTSKFYYKFYSDSSPRHMIFGINPGRFGGGITGIPFTDPVKLEEKCGIANEYKKVKELSAEFVYKVIEALGGPEPFYKKFFISAISPLGFTFEGKNMNYYDDKELIRSLEKFIVECILKQIKTISVHSRCYCLGEGANFKYFLKLNQQFHFFETIISLPHPRWIMQYRRKQVDRFVDAYVNLLK